MRSLKVFALIAIMALLSGCIVSQPSCGKTNGDPIIVHISSELTTRVDGWGVVSGTIKNFGTRAPGRLEVIVNFRDKSTGEVVWWEFALLNKERVCPGDEADFYLQTILQGGMKDWADIWIDVYFRYY